MRKAFSITPVHDLLLRGTPDMPVGLYHLHIATAEQLTRLHYKAGMLKTVKARLKTLADHGYVQADCVPTKQFRSPYYYALGKMGIRYLAATGVDLNEALRAGKEVDKHYLFIAHALELNDILIAALRLRLTDPRFYLARFIHERTLKQTPYTVAQDGQRMSVIPDGFLDVQQHRAGMSDLSLPLVLEHDRGTEEQQHFRRRIRAYRAFLHAGAHTQLFGVERLTIAFTTFVGPRRVMQMREWTRAELTSEPQLADLFLFAELPRPLEPRHLFLERRWYTLQNNQPLALLES